MDPGEREEKNKKAIIRPAAGREGKDTQKIVELGTSDWIVRVILVVSLALALLLVGSRWSSWE